MYTRSMDDLTVSRGISLVSMGDVDVQGLHMNIHVERVLQRREEYVGPTSVRHTSVPQPSTASFPSSGGEDDNVA